MARLARGERTKRHNRILRLIRSSFGIRESEIADELQLDRRTVNRYLHDIAQNGEAHREGWHWYEN